MYFDVVPFQTLESMMQHADDPAAEVRALVHAALRAGPETAAWAAAEMAIANSPLEPATW